MASYSSLSTQYVKAEVRVRDSGAPADPTGFAVYMAFMLEGEDPEAGDWLTAAWETVVIGTFTSYWARVVPTGLTKGEKHVVWVKVAAGPQIAIMAADELLEVY